MEPKSSKRTGTEVRLSVLEHTVVGQNASVDRRLESMERVLKEIHDKQDQYILNTSVGMEALKGQIALNAERTSAVNSKVNKFFGGILTLCAAIIGGLVKAMYK